MIKSAIYKYFNMNPPKREEEVVEISSLCKSEKRKESKKKLAIVRMAPKSKKRK